MAETRRQKDLVNLTNVEFETSEEVDVVTSFDKLNLKDDLLRGIYAYGK